MTPVVSAAFAGRELPIVAGEMDDEPNGRWRLVVWATADDTSMPADGWLEAVTATGEFVAWGTLIERTSNPGDVMSHRLTFVDAVAPEGESAPVALGPGTLLG